MRAQLRNRLNRLSHEFAVGLRLERGNEYVVPSLRQRGFSFNGNPRPFAAVGEAREQTIDAALERPLRQQLRHDRAAGDVRITIETHVDASRRGLFDAIECDGLLVPVARAHSLEVRYLEAASGAAREIELLVDGLDQPVRIIPHVRGVDLAVTGGHAAQTLNLFTRRAGAWGVHQAGRETTGAFGQGLRELLLH